MNLEEWLGASSCRKVETVSRWELYWDCKHERKCSSKKWQTIKFILSLSASRKGPISLKRVRTIVVALLWSQPCIQHFGLFKCCFGFMYTDNSPNIHFQILFLPMATFFVGSQRCWYFMSCHFNKISNSGWFRNIFNSSFSKNVCAGFYEESALELDRFFANFSLWLLFDVRVCASSAPPSLQWRTVCWFEISIVDVSFYNSYALAFSTLVNIFPRTIMPITNFYDLSRSKHTNMELI